MKTHALLLAALLSLLSFGSASAQFSDFEDDTSSDNNNHGGRNVRRGDRFVDHLRFGGEFGIGFGSNSFSAQFDPQVGYCFNRYVTAGLICTLEYYKYGNYSITSSVYGGGLYADAHPLDFLVAHMEAQAICYDDYSGYNYFDSEKKWDAPILLGGGYHRQITDRASVNFMLLWNLNATNGLENNTSFNNPILRLNVMF